MVIDLREMSALLMAECVLNIGLGNFGAVQEKLEVLYEGFVHCCVVYKPFSSHSNRDERQSLMQSMFYGLISVS